MVYRTGDSLLHRGGEHMRWKLREPSEPSAEEFSNMDPYSIAFLNKGKVLAVNSAITSLVERKLLKADASRKEVIRRWRTSR